MIACPYAIFSTTSAAVKTNIVNPFGHVHSVISKFQIIFKSKLI